MKQILFCHFNLFFHVGSPPFCLYYWTGHGPVYIHVSCMSTSRICQYAFEHSLDEFKFHIASRFDEHFWVSSTRMVVKIDLIQESEVAFSVNIHVMWMALVCQRCCTGVNGAHQFSFIAFNKLRTANCINLIITTNCLF